MFLPQARRRRAYPEVVLYRMKAGYPDAGSKLDQSELSCGNVTMVRLMDVGGSRLWQRFQAHAGWQELLLPSRAVASFIVFYLTSLYRLIEPSEAVRPQKTDYDHHRTSKDTHRRVRVHGDKNYPYHPTNALRKETGLPAPIASRPT